MNLPQQIDLFFFRFLMVRQWRSESVAIDPPHSMDELSILELIDRFDGLLLKNVSSFLQKPVSSISEAISKLENLGLLRREKGAGLEKHLHLTPLGKETLDANRIHCTFSVSNALVKRMTGEERELVSKCLVLLNQKQQEVLEDVFRGNFEI